MFDRAPGTAGLVCLIRADGLALDAVPRRLRRFSAPPSGRRLQRFCCERRPAAIKLGSHFLQPRQPGASGHQDQASLEASWPCPGLSG